MAKACLASCMVAKACLASCMVAKASLASCMVAKACLACNMVIWLQRLAWQTSCVDGPLLAKACLAVHGLVCKWCWV